MQKFMTPIALIAAVAIAATAYSVSSSLTTNRTDCPGKIICPLTGELVCNPCVYGEAALEKLLFVRSAQAAGFTLGDIDALLEFRESDAAPCKEVQDLIAVRLDLVVEQIKHLKVVDRMLRDWMKVCHEAEHSGFCGVIEGLQAPREKKCKEV